LPLVQIGELIVPFGTQELVLQLALQLQVAPIKSPEPPMPGVARLSCGFSLEVVGHSLRSQEAPLEQEPKS
jgi:hypothetical protein